MSKYERRASRLVPHDFKAMLKMESEAYLGAAFVNEKAHDAKHAPSTIVYTSAAELTTDAGSKIRFPRGGVVTRIAGKVQGAPVSTALTFNLYIDGISVTDSAVSIAATETQSQFRMVTRPNFNEDSSMYIQIAAVSSATGPLVVTIEYLPGW